MLSYVIPSQGGHYGLRRIDGSISSVGSYRQLVECTKGKLAGATSLVNLFLERKGSMRKGFQKVSDQLELVVLVGDNPGQNRSEATVLAQHFSQGHPVASLLF